MRQLLIVSFLIISFLIFNTACSSSLTTDPNESNPAADLAAAKARWELTKTGVGSYKLGMGYSGMTGYFKVISSVDNRGALNDCLESYKEWNTGTVTNTQCATSNGATVENLFKMIDALIASGALVRAEYDSEFGVPKSILLQNDKRIADMTDVPSGSYVAVEFDFPTPYLIF
jgi:hypothetical protein